MTERAGRAASTKLTMKRSPLTFQELVKSEVYGAQGSRCLHVAAFAQAAQVHREREIERNHGCLLNYQKGAIAGVAIKFTETCTIQ